MKKFFFVFILSVSLILASNPIKAIEDNNGYIGINIYKFVKPRLAKEITIINVIPNSPAWYAGIKIADRILKVNEIDVKAMSVEEVQKLISGKVNSNVKLTLKTREGIKDFSIKRTQLDINQVSIYPQWKNFCTHKKTEHEVCFIHSNDIIKKTIEFGYGPAYVSNIGRNISYQRYAFENNLYLCAKTKDPAMCYIQLQQNMQNKALAVQMHKEQIRQQQINNLIQNTNHVDTNMELRNINQNLNNMNMNLQMLRY